uniref:Uncharacterized protein n=1 Tax=Peronospora matthiolae TaxID=2874970 RepID=A0AAV1UT95_9STRA
MWSKSYRIWELVGSDTSPRLQIRKLVRPDAGSRLQIWKPADNWWSSRKPVDHIMRLLLCLSSAFATDPSGRVVDRWNWDRESQSESGEAVGDDSSDDDHIQEERVLPSPFSLLEAPRAELIGPRHPAAFVEKIGVQARDEWVVDSVKLKDWLYQVEEYRGQGKVFTDEEMVNVLLELHKEHKNSLLKALLSLRDDPSMALRADALTTALCAADTDVQFLAYNVWLNAKVDPDVVFHLIPKSYIKGILPDAVNAEESPLFSKCMLWLIYVVQYRAGMG